MLNFYKYVRADPLKRERGHSASKHDFSRLVWRVEPTLSSGSAAIQPLLCL